MGLIALSTEEIDEWKKKYDKESFPGLEVPMEDVTAMMTAPDPGAAVGAKAISAAGKNICLILVYLVWFSCWIDLAVKRRLLQRLGVFNYQVFPIYHLLLQSS